MIAGNPNVERAYDCERMARLAAVAALRNGPAAQYGLRVLFAGEPAWPGFYGERDDYQEYLARVAAWQREPIP